MSFRENLQYLRGTRNMTQEQLAMLLLRLTAGHLEMGVRESISGNGQIADDLRPVRRNA